jgi:NADPH:quinone reductase-like Zn-dependent oxidoreductase
MRAVTLAAVPAEPAVTEIETPSPEPGEVLVKVAASSVNGFDAAIAAGYLQGVMEHRFPLVIGKDFAGTVEAVGAGVDAFAAGDPVFGVVMKPYLGTGSLAEYVTVPAGYGLTRIPAGLGTAHAGALGLAGIAALDSLALADVGKGETVLVSGATGGVGAIALQYLAGLGATVIATARPGAETDFVRGLAGPDLRVVDYTGDLAAQLDGTVVDAALHLAGDGGRIAGLVRDGGRVVSTIGLTADAVGGRDVAVHAVMADATADKLARLGSDAADGTIRVPVTASYPLADTARAFAAFGAGALGKLSISL